MCLFVLHILLILLSLNYRLNYKRCYGDKNPQFNFRLFDNLELELKKGDNMPMLTDYLSEEYCRAYIKAFDRGAVSDQKLYENCKAFMSQLKETQLFPMVYNGHTTDTETVEGAEQYHTARIGDTKFFAEYGFAELVDIQAPKQINKKYRFHPRNVDSMFCKTYQLQRGAKGYDF